VAIVRGLPKRGCHEQAPAVLGLMTATPGRTRTAVADGCSLTRAGPVGSSVH